jgi:hypothetical protein
MTAHGDPSAAMLAPFEPAVPCRHMETRPCVNLPTDPTDLDGYLATQATRYRDTECTGPCARYPHRDQEATHAET